MKNVHYLTPWVVGAFAGLFIFGLSHIISFPYIFPFSWLVVIFVIGLLIYTGIYLLLPARFVESEMEAYVRRIEALGLEGLDHFYAARVILEARGIARKMRHACQNFRAEVKDEVLSICSTLDEIIEGIIADPNSVNKSSLFMARIKFAAGVVSEYASLRRELEGDELVLSPVRNKLVGSLQNVRAGVEKMRREGIEAKVKALDVEMGVLETAFSDTTS